MAIIWGWCTVWVANVLMGLVLSEMASAYPTAGGVFFWAGRLGGREWGPFSSWMVGFYCLLGGARRAAV